MLHALLLLSLIWCTTANHGSDQCDFRRHGIIEGNITLGFMFPFFDSVDETSTACDETSIPNLSSIQLLEAAIFALRRGQPRIPGITIGLEAYDSCSSTTVALDHSTFFLRDRFVGNSTEESLGSCGEKLKPGFLGSLHDELGIVVGSFLSNSLVTVTGYASELPQLTTSEEYEYFTRTIPSDAEEIEVWTSFLQAANWTYVSVVYSQGENQLTDARLFEERAKSAMICISKLYGLNDPTDLTEMDNIYGLILQSDVDAVVLILEDELGEDFLKAVANKKNGRKMQFLVPFDLYLEVTDEIDLPDNVTIVGAVPDITHPGNGDDAFDTYFKNLTHLTYDDLANPWFKYYWENRYDCAINVSSENRCGADAVAAHKRLYKRNPFVTPVIDAVDAHIETLATLLQCEGQCDLTDITFNPEDYLDTLKQVNLSRNEGSRNRIISFTPNGDPADNKFLILLTSKNKNETLIYRWDNGKLNRPPFFDVANLLSPSECGDPCGDASCFALRELEEQAQAYSEGDIILAGFFPVNEWDIQANECGDLTGIGVLYVQAMLYAIDKINEDPSILPDIQVGMDGFNTCSSPQKATDIAHELATQGVFGGSSSATRLSPDGKRIEHFFGVIGPKSLEETMGVNQITRSRKVPMIGYDTDSPTINTFSYRYFARVLPSSVSNIHPFLQYISRNNITYFQILYSGNRYQSPTSTIISYLESGSWTGVCSAQAVQIPASVEGETESMDAWNDTFVTMQKKPDAKAVYLALSNEDILRVLEQMNMKGLFGKYILLAGPTWELTEEEETNFAEVVRGAVIIKSKPRTYESFEQYIGNLSLPDTRNPWLSDYCSQNSQGAECTGTTTVFKDLMKDEAIARIIDSTYAMAHALHNVQMMLCPGTTRVCKAMLEADGDTIFETLTRMTNFISINDDRPIRFDFSGSLLFSYEIFNYQQNGGTVRREKVGQIENWLFTDEEEVKFYDESGMEIQSSTASGSRCSHVTCEKECRRPDHDAVAEISDSNGNGDVWIGGFFEVTEPAQDPLQCTDEIIDENVPLVEAFLYAIEKINNDPTILPDLMLAGIAFDSCGSPSRAIKEAGNFVAGTIDYRSRFSSQQLNVFGIIGGGSSDTTAALSQTLADLGINQISYAATAVEFSDPLDHPYLLRTVPSDLSQAAAFVDILDYFSWNYVSVVYSDNLFGNDMLNEFTKRIEEDRTFCVAMMLRVQRETFSEADYDSIVTTLQSNPNSRVVLMFTSDVDTRSVLQAANRMDINDLQWVGSDTWGVNDHVIENTNITVLGALTISFESQRVPSFEGYFQNLYPWTYRRNPWFQSYYSDFFECDLSQSHGYGVWCNVAVNTFPAEAISKNPLVVNVINAVYAYAHGLQSALDKYCSEDVINNHICTDLLNRPTEFHNIIQDTMFPSAHNESILFKFNEFGDIPGNYDIFNIRKENGSISYKKVGSWSEGSLNFTEDPLFFRNGDNVAAFQTTCKGRCTECIKPDFTYVSLDGPIQIVGLAGVHDPGDHVNECGSLSNMGVMDVEAFLFAIDYVNGQDDILPGVQLGAKIFDTCQSSARGVREVSSFFGSAGLFADTAEWYLIGGIISGGVPSVIESGYQVAEQYKHPQVVYTPSPPSLNDAEYLIKVSPSVSSQVEAILDLLQRYGWTFISVIADSSDKQQIILYNTFNQAAGDLCLDQNLLFTADTLDATLSSLRGPANVVVMFASAAMINRMPKSASYHNTFVFAGVGSYESIKFSDAIAGSLILSYSQRSASFEDLLNEQLAANSTTNSRNPWLTEFFSRKLSCNVGSISKFDSRCNDGVSISIDQSEIVNAKFIVNSVIALARSLSNVHNETCEVNSGLCSDFVATDEEKFLAAITHIGTFPDENGRQVVFENGQQQVDFSIWNIPPENGKNFVKVDEGTSPTFVDENGMVTGTVKSVCPPDATTTPQITTSNYTVMETKPATMPTATTTPMPTAMPTATTTPQMTTSNYTIMETKPATMPPSTTSSQVSKSSETSKTGNEALAQSYEDFHERSWFIIALVLSGIGIIVTIIMMVIFFRKSETIYAQCHSSFLVYFLLFAVLVMFLQTVLFGLQVNVAICALRRIVPGVTFFTCFLSILLMSVRFFRVRKRDNLGSGLGTKYIDNQSQIIAAACILPMESVILLQWLLYEPPSTGVVDENGVIHCTNINSTFSVSFLGIYILMVGSLVVSVLGLRRSKTHFAAELTSIVVCIAVSSIIAAAWILCSFLKDEGFLVAATAFAGIFQGFVVLVTILPFIIKGLLRKEQFQVDSMSVIDGDSGFTNPVSALEDPNKEAPSVEKAKEAMAELKITEEESTM
ncbi:Metabotropic glutamate receptor 2 [Holothuria leucospilota]|uniref:Metabotropic glutamate receptor 2 n=1 Tax=Holothuria leucospilota TaxID=206669 RepID=A0A9Q0YJ21_HOLLE|nr:Metabotropic glutamate receptor 2 [Holothuria leucospilota]